MPMPPDSGSPVTGAPLTGMPRITPFLAGQAIRRQPAWSPTGSLLAYVSNEAGNEDIWVCDASGTSAHNLTADFRGADSHPAWSPDGQRIAFFSERDGGGIYIMPVLGGPARKLASVKPEILFTFSLSWAKNGQILYTNFNDHGIKQVYAITESNLASECLTARAGAPDGHFGELSPSGNLLAFLDAGINLTAGLWIGDLRSGTCTKVEHGVGNPHWGPQDDRLFFISGRQGSVDLWMIDVDPRTGRKLGNARRITSGQGVTNFTFAPDGRRLVAVKSKSQSRLWSFPTHEEHLTDLQSGKPLTAGGFTDTHPSWSADGKTLLFSSNRRGNSDLWKLAPDTASPIALTRSPGNKEHACLSSDGRWIAFTLVDELGEYLHVIRADGTASHLLDPRLPELYAATYQADWSPDGARLAAVFESKKRNGNIGIARMDAETGTARQIKLLDLAGESPICPRWSPDGRFLVYEAVSHGNWDLWITTPDGHDPHQLTFGPGNQRTASWSRDGRFLYFVKDQRSVWRLPMDPASGQSAGPPQLWAEFPKTKIAWDSLAVAKDQIVISVTEEASDWYLLEFPEN